MAVVIECRCFFCNIKKWHSPVCKKTVWGFFDWEISQVKIYTHLDLSEDEILILKSHKTKLRMCRECSHVYIYVPKLNRES